MVTLVGMHIINTHRAFHTRNPNETNIGANRGYLGQPLKITCTFYIHIVFGVITIIITTSYYSHNECYA